MASIFPEQVEIKEKDLEKLGRVFKRAYVDIVKEITGTSDFTLGNRQALLSQIEAILTVAGVDVQAFLNESLPGYYAVGADFAIKQLKNMHAEIPVMTGFNVVHQDAIQFLVDDTLQSMFQALTGVRRSADLLINKTTRDLITQRIATESIAGTPLRQAAQKVKALLVEEGLPALKDKAGRSWTLDRYAQTVFRTKVVEARNHGFANRLVENGFDLVQVSTHQGACELCRPWEGKILSITGNDKKYPSLARAETDGLFHPNCRHAINLITPSLAEKTKAYQANI